MRQRHAVRAGRGAAPARRSPQAARQWPSGDVL